MTNIVALHQAWLVVRWASARKSSWYVTSCPGRQRPGYSILTGWLIKLVIGRLSSTHCWNY